MLKSFPPASVLLNAASMRTNPGTAAQMAVAVGTAASSLQHYSCDPCAQTSGKTRATETRVRAFSMEYLSSKLRMWLTASRCALPIICALLGLFWLVSTLENLWDPSYSVPVLSPPLAYRSACFPPARFTIDGNWCPVAFPRPCLPLQPLFILRPASPSKHLT